MDSHSDVGRGSRFNAPVTRWTDIPGWFQWRDAQQEAVTAFGGDSIFVEVGCYLGRSLCSLADLVCQAGNGITLVGVDTCRGSGPEVSATPTRTGLRCCKAEEPWRGCCIAT